MVELVGWRAVFWLLTVVAGIVLALTWWVVPAAPPVGSRRGLDPAGTATAVIGLVLLVIGAGLVEDPDLVPVPPGAVLLAGATCSGCSC